MPACRAGLFALTFDDAPTDNFERMLDILKEHHVRTTLFVVGEYLRDPESVSLVKRAEEEGKRPRKTTCAHLSCASWRTCDREPFMGPFPSLRVER